MAKKKFNPGDWQDLPPDRPPQEPEDQIQPRRIPTPINRVWSDTLEEQIAEVTRRIEVTSTDITAGYDNWRDIGFALADALGEGGREYFHRVSRFYPQYDQQEADRQFTHCVQGKRTGITYRTFFQKAKDAGISVSFPSEKPTQIFPSTDGTDGSDALMETPVPEAMPTFSQDLYGHLPGILDEVVRNATSNEDADLLILGALVSFSACLTKIYGVYAGRQVYSNLFLFVTAPASAGKGRLSLCRRLVQPIHDQMRDLYKTEMEAYNLNKSRYDHDKKKNPDLVPPEEPPLRMLIIPANSSATSVYQILSDNGGNGLMFETEGDTLADVFTKDYGNYSDGFRKAFHHEAISYTRRKDREFVELLRPRLTAVLSGTPRQVAALIPDAENGLFSRFIFYYLDFKLEWLNVFARVDGSTLEQIFDDIGWGFTDLYQRLEMQPEMEFQFTQEQENRFNAHYARLQVEYHTLFGIDIIASVRRLGLITFRMAMILSALRLADTGEEVSTLICDDEDFDTAMTISQVLIQHTVRVFRELSSDDLNKPASERTARLQQYLDSLPASFSTKSYLEFADRLGIPHPSAERYIKNWCRMGLLHRIKQGYYEKSKS